MPSVDNLATTKHIDVITRFRKNIEPVTPQEYSDEYLLRILKAKNFNLQKAEEFLKFVYNVRQTYEMDTLAENYHKPEIMKRCEFAAFMGFDKNGSPIIYIALGNADFEGFVRASDSFEICNYCTYCIEKLLKFQRENDNKMGIKREGNMSAIFDFEDFSLQQIMMRSIIEIGLDMMRMFQDVYPGIVQRVYLINVPVYFSAVFNIFKPILKIDLVEKFVICSKENTPSELLKYIDADVLPVFLGGNKVDENGDPYCSAFLKSGCKVPEEEYGIYKELLNLSDPEVSEMTIPARATLDLEFEVLEPKSKLHIEMWSDNGFGLSIYYQNSSNSNKLYMENNRQSRSLEMVSPYAKIHSHLAPVDAKIFCSRAGTYIFRFDNSYSWISSKRVVYRIRVLPPFPAKNGEASSN